MYPDISQLPSRVFYKGLLKDGPGWGDGEGEMGRREGEIGWESIAPLCCMPVSTIISMVSMCGYFADLSYVVKVVLRMVLPPRLMTSLASMIWQRV